MEQHLKARLNDNDKICEYIGGNEIVFSEIEMNNFVKYVIGNISKNYEIIFKSDDFNWNYDLIFGTLNKDSKYYYFEFNNEINSISFSMTDEGYRYQFNKYMQSEDKRSLESAKLAQKANLFLAITTIYYVGSFIFLDLDYNLKNFLSRVFSSSVFLSFVIINLFLILVIYVLDRIINKENKD